MNEQALTREGSRDVARARETHWTTADHRRTAGGGLASPRVRAGCVSSQHSQMELSAPEAARQALHTSGTTSRLRRTSRAEYTPVKGRFLPWVSGLARLIYWARGGRSP